jgi:hypothetical protein
VLKKYYVKNADLPRNYKLTFKDDGFYRALKSKVAKVLPLLDYSVTWKSKLVVDTVSAGFLLSSVVAAHCDAVYAKFIFILIAGIFGSLIPSLTHNFYHQKNNWRMYVANFMLAGHREWRIYHILVRKNICF